MLSINSYNVDVAKVLGVRTAVLLSYLHNQYQNQLLNNTLNNTNTMSVSRGSIYENTALDDNEQIDIEVSLVECGVLTVKPVKNAPNKNYYIIHNEQLLKILNATNPSDVLSTAKASQFIKGKRSEPVSKRQSHISKMKKMVKVEDPIMQDYFIQWVDSVYANPKGYLSAKAVEIAQQELLEYAKGDQDLQVKIIIIAIKNSWRDIQWAISKYEELNGDNRNFTTFTDNRDALVCDTGEVY